MSRFFLLIATCFAVPFSLAASIDEDLQQFFDLIRIHEYELAYSKLLEGSIIVRQNPKAIQTMAKASQSLKDSGMELGEYRLVLKREIANFAQLRVYFVELGEVIIVYELVFTHRGNGWSLLNISFSDESDDVKRYLLETR